MRKICVVFLLGCTLPLNVLFAEETEPWFSWELLWTGSYTGSYKTAEEDEFSAEEFFAHGTFLNRGDFRLDLPQQFLSLRFQVLDRRRIPPEDKYEPVFSPGFGFYYTGGGVVGNYLGGARLLRGVLEEQGLPARVRNVWAKSAPFAENRKPVTVDLKNDVSASREPETSLFLETPVFNFEPLGNIRGYLMSGFDDDLNLSLSGGMEALWSRTGNFRFDAFYTRRELEARKASAWFSAAPPLPERDFRFWALGTIFNTENFGFAFDTASSETFAYGSDVYASGGIRIGNKPWKFSFAADGAGSRFVDRAGSAAGEGLRLAGRLERQWIRSGLFRTNAVIRSSSFGGEFDRGNFSVYFRPSAPPPREIPWFRFTRASLSLARDARTSAKTIDGLDAYTGFNFGSVRSVFSFGIHSLSALENDSGLFSTPFFESVESYKIAGELSFTPGFLTLRTKLSYTARAEKDPLWDISLNTSLRPGKNTRVSLKIASPDFPEKWNYTLSWRLQI